MRYVLTLQYQNSSQKKETKRNFEFEMWEAREGGDQEGDVQRIRHMTVHSIRIGLRNFRMCHWLLVRGVILDILNSSLRVSFVVTVWFVIKTTPRKQMKSNLLITKQDTSSICISVAKNRVCCILSSPSIISQFVVAVVDVAVVVVTVVVVI